MNIYIISLLDTMVQKNITVFSHLDFVESTKYFANPELLSYSLERVSNFFFSFFQKLNFIPIGAFKENHYGHYNLDDENIHNRTILEAIDKIKHNELIDEGILPVHLRFSDADNLHLVAGLVRMENKNRGTFHLVDLFLPKMLLKSIPPSVTYVRDILDSYTNDFLNTNQKNNKETVVDYVTSKGYYYNKFIRDCKIYFGDTFYTFILKRKMTQAVSDIIFTDMSLKEIAFKNNFDGYKIMHKTFVRYGVTLSEAPRLAIKS